MTLSIRNTLRSLSALVLTAAFLPGCDGEDYEALGLSVEQLDRMSEEELDELAEIEAENEALELDVSMPEPPGTHGGSEPSKPTNPGLADSFWNPRWTHLEAEPSVPMIDEFTDPVRPTHDPLALDIRNEAPGGCQPDQPDELLLAAG